MVRVFYSQKTEQMLKKMELMHWRELDEERIGQKHQKLSDDWKTRVIGKRILRAGRDIYKIKIPSSIAINHDYDFSDALQKKDSEKALEFIEEIEQLQSMETHDGS